MSASKTIMISRVFAIYRSPLTIYELTECSFPIDRDDLSCGKVVGEWSSLAPLGAPRPHQPSALGLVGAFLCVLLGLDYSALEYVRVLSKPGIT
jgi:hypothetical protein